MFTKLAHAPRRCAQAALFVFLLTGVLVPLKTAQAHLALLRQGLESGEVPNAGDRHGEKTITGDFNNDGYDDLAVASTKESNSINNLGDHGLVTINWGTEFGLTHLSPNPSILTVGEPNDSDVFFGQGLAVGDFNGDGFDDLAVGAPSANIFTTHDAGQVYVYAGASFGINLAPYLVLDQTDGPGSSIEQGDLFGFSLASGNFNGDAYDDLAVGSVGENSNGGALFTFYGTNTGLSTTDAGLMTLQHVWGSHENGAQFGAAMVAGDFRGSSVDDLCVSAPYLTTGPNESGGAVFVLWGTPANGLISSQVYTVTPQSLGVEEQSTSGFGWSLAAGQLFAADGDDDLAIGEPLFNVDGKAGAGRVLVVSTVDAANPPPNVKVLTQDDSAGFVLSGARFGWSLATGRFNVDIYDALAVGAPYRDLIVGSEFIAWDDVGTTDLFFGAGGGPTGFGALSLSANDLNDDLYAFEEHLGTSVAFGDFDGNGREALVTSAPGKSYPAYIDDDTVISAAGQVHVYAPWRQPGGNNPHRSALVYDCAGNIVYSQRLGQRLTPASTTKALTALMAVEAMQADPTLADQLFQIKPWVANNVTGSQYGLFPGEWMSFEDLTEVMMAVSGNDAAYTIGDILSGEDNEWTDGVSTLANVLSDFAAMMNQRAAQMGLSSAHVFSNPAGRPFGDHWTTAQDMADFVVAAMANPGFRDLVDSSGYDVTRYLPLSQMIPWIPPGPPLPVNDFVSYGWLNSLKGWYSDAIGVKPGGNSPSQRTAIMSGELDSGEVTAVYFGHPRSDPDANELGSDLLSLVDSDCDPSPPSGAVPPVAVPHAVGQGFPTLDGSFECVSASIDDVSGNDLLIDVALQDVGTGDTSMTVFIERQTEMTLPENGTCQFGIAAAHEWSGVQITNSGDQLAEFNFIDPVLSTQFAIVQPGDSITLPAGSFPSAGALNYTLINVGPEAVLTIHELGYGHQIQLSQSRNTWSTSMSMSCPGVPTNVSVCILGEDVSGGATVGVSIRGTDSVTTSVDGASGNDVASAVARVVGNAPNPFNPRTLIVYEIHREADAVLSVYDLAGRLVRTLENGLHQPGRYEVAWDGTNDAGAAVASGVYVYRLQGESFDHSDKMTLLK